MCKIIAGLLTALFILFSTQADENKTISVLFTGYRHHTCGFEQAKLLQAAGINVDQTPKFLDATTLSEQMLKKYNVVVLTGIGTANADGSLSEQNKANISALTNYLSNGGGVIFIPTFCQQERQLPPQLEFAKNLGFKPLFDQTIYDPETEVIATSWKIPFARTENLSPSPITTECERLWYPVSTMIGAQTHTIPFELDDPWNVFLKGSKTAYFHPFKSPESPKQKPVLLGANRTYGKGRIVVFPITPEYLFENVALTTLEGVVFNKGLQGEKSDGFDLIKNAIRYCAAPSLETGELGGAPMNRGLLKNPFKIDGWTKPYNWNAPKSVSHNLQSFPGFIGAKSTYSGGKNSVKEWIETAKTNNFRYLVFLEDFAELSESEFNSLKKECKQYSNEDFSAIPGFYIDDAIGNHYFYFASTLSYPTRKMLDESGKVFISMYKDKPSRISSTTLEYFHGLNSSRLTAGTFLMRSDASPCSNWFSNFDALGVWVRKNNVLIENAFQEYKEIVDAGQGPLPLAINLMDDATLLADAPEKTVVRAENHKELLDYWKQWHFYPDNPTRIYITAGPVIEDWSFTGPRDYEGFNKGNFVWQNLRWNIDGKVSSSFGLKEIIIYDGTEIFRRFLLNGEKEFSFMFPLTHDKQHNLIMEVTDINGKKAISREQWDRNHRIEEFNCGDRNNQLSYGMSINRDGFKILLGGNLALATPNKRLGGTEIDPIYTFRNDPLLGAPAFDGGAYSAPTIFSNIFLKAYGKRIFMPTALEAKRILHTGDVNIGEAFYKHNFTDNVKLHNVWATLWRVEPAKDFTVKRRYHFFQIDPDSPVAVFLWESTIVLNKDIANSGAQIAFVRRGDDKMITLRSSNGEVISVLWDDEMKTSRRPITEPFDPGSYLAHIDSPMGSLAIIPLTKGLEATFTLPKRSRTEINLKPEFTPQKEGESKEVRLLFIGLPHNTRLSRKLSSSSNEPFEMFVRQFGFLGAPEYKVTAQCGAVVDQRYPLTLSMKDGAFSGTIDGKLMTTLPVCLQNANDRWSAYLYDRNLKKSRPLGISENKIWATIPMKGDNKLFIGHPITCDQPKISIQVSQISDHDWRIDLNNTTQEDITTTIAPSPYFDPFKGLKDLSKPIQIAAGTMVTLDVKADK